MNRRAMEATGGEEWGVERQERRGSERKGPERQERIAKLSRIINALHWKTLRRLEK